MAHSDKQEWVLLTLGTLLKRYGEGNADDRATTPAIPTSSRARRANAPIVASDVRAEVSPEAAAKRPRKALR